MCGIVGLFLKDSTMAPELGRYLSEMLVTMTDRGPDSAGIAIYGQPGTDQVKLTVQSPDPDRDFDLLEARLPTVAQGGGTVLRKSSHAVVTVQSKDLDACRNWLEEQPSIRLISFGNSMEIYKEVGLPTEVISRFGVDRMAGTHGIGHTRMATESAVTTLGAHPFSTGPDQCLVHNGSLSNHNNTRRHLIHEGLSFETENDSEVAAAYLTWRMSSGMKLGDALTAALDDLDGFYTFLVGTEFGFGVLRDPVACKPAVMAETDRYVAFGSEYRALVGLPDIQAARVWEPEPETVYFWEH
jgi:glutamate synthase domain-containing protein 1